MTDSIERLNELNREWFRGFRVAAFSVFFGVALAFLITGCGDAGTGRSTSLPAIDIQCDETSCTILVWEADTITTWRDGEFYWFEDVVPPGRRYTNRDSAPEVSLTVEACNETGCVERALVVLELAQNDENDPLGCDPTLPCPIEALS